MKKPLQYSTLTLCALKGTCQDGQYKGLKHAMNCMLCILCMLTLLTLVFVAFTQTCILCICLQEPLTLPGGKAYCSHQSCGFSGSPVQGGSFVHFLELVNNKGDCRQDAQPIPNS